jgi:hypothetical protein
MALHSAQTPAAHVFSRVILQQQCVLCRDNYFCLVAEAAWASLRQPVDGTGVLFPPSAVAPRLSFVCWQASSTTAARVATACASLLTRRCAAAKSCCQSFTPPCWGQLGRALWLRQDSRAGSTHV